VSTKVFINYRRSGDASRHVAGRIYDRLCQDLGKDCVFIDVDKIPLGRNFLTYLDEQIAKCDYVLALIGPAWIDVRDERGQRRLDDPKDWVRIELVAALRRGIPVVPVLVDGGQLPAEEDLPEGLRELPLLQALPLTETGFHHELDRLVGEIKGGQEQEGAHEPSSPTEPTKQDKAEPGIIVSPKSGIELVRIEGGRFLMGAPESEKESAADERPQHWVTLSTFQSRSLSEGSSTTEDRPISGMGRPRISRRSTIGLDAATSTPMCTCVHRTGVMAIRCSRSTRLASAARARFVEQKKQQASLCALDCGSSAANRTALAKHACSTGPHRT
jgi:hypothetical protein